MGNKHGKGHPHASGSAFNTAGGSTATPVLPQDINKEIKDFNKLCSDILKLRGLFNNTKYIKMIGFDMGIKIYFTP